MSVTESLPVFYTNEFCGSFETALRGLIPEISRAQTHLNWTPEDPLYRDIRGYKNTPVYVAHSYPTKIPPEAIVPYIDHYTRPGQTILDPFCGSGMTGVAAQLAGRHALLNDLNLGAMHLAYNHCTPCDPEELLSSFNEVAAQCEGEFRWLYGTRCNRCRGPARIIYTLWSDVFGCLRCGKPLVIWDVALRRSDGRVAEQIRCPKCRKINRKRLLRRYGQAVPVLTNFECLGSCSSARSEHKPTRAELRLMKEVNEAEIPYRYPSLDLDPNAEMYIRCALHLQGIKNVADFYTKRNLRALAKIWREIELIADRRVRAALAFAFTNTAWHATKMRRFNARGGQRPLTGTLYIPQLSAEANPMPILKHKIQTLLTFYRYLETARSDRKSSIYFRLDCATNFKDIEANSVDYVFTDPPFGSNIFYSDLNLIWESWLGKVSDATREAVINRSKKDGKTLAEYFKLMKSAFKEMYRVLKPGHWASVVFHNSNEEVWRAIQTAASESGFVLAHAGGIDKTKRSMRGYIGRKNDENIADGDVVLNLRKPKEAATIHVSKLEPSHFEELIVMAISDHLACLNGVSGAANGGPQLDPRSLQYLHGLAIRTILNGGYVIEKVSFSDIRELCIKHFIVEEGRVFLPSTRIQSTPESQRVEETA